MMISLTTKYHLSTEGYYFKHEDEFQKATLYRSDTDEKVDEFFHDGAISKNGIDSHFKVINYFEARLSLGIIS